MATLAERVEVVRYLLLDMKVARTPGQLPLLLVWARLAI